MAIQQTVNYSRQTDIPVACRKCNGSCYVKHDNTKTQENAHKLLGESIHADCVNMQDGTPNCPAALGYIM